MQIGNTELDMPRLRIYGPLRPRLTMGPVQRNAAAAQVFDPLTSAQAQAQAIDNVTRGFLRWYLWGGLGLLLFSLAAAAGAGCLRMLAVLRARSRAGEDAGPHAVAEIWHHLVRRHRADDRARGGGLGAGLGRGRRPGLHRDGARALRRSGR